MSVYHIVYACRRDWRVRDHTRNLVRNLALLFPFSRIITDAFFSSNSSRIVKEAGQSLYILLMSRLCARC